MTFRSPAPHRKSSGNLGSAKVGGWKPSGYVQRKFGAKEQARATKRKEKANDGKEQ